MVKVSLLSEKPCNEVTQSVFERPCSSTTHQQPSNPTTTNKEEETKLDLDFRYSLVALILICFFLILFVESNIANPESQVVIERVEERVEQNGKEKIFSPEASKIEQKWIFNCCFTFRFFNFCYNYIKTKTTSICNYRN